MRFKIPNSLKAHSLKLQALLRLSWVQTVIALLLLSSIFIFRPFVVTGGSMEPHYSHGDVLLIERLSHHIRVWRGEALVMRNPHDKRVIEVKRVIGLPNETVELSDRGVAAIRESGESEQFETGTLIGGEFSGPFRIKLGPEDYFVLGDNRSKSSDSRTFGAVQKSDIIGHVLFSL